MINDKTDFSDYTLGSKLTWASHNRFYIAQSTGSATRAVIKIFSIRRLSDQESKQFLQEAESLINLQHYAILPLLKVGIKGRLPYLVMDYAVAGSLREHLPSLFSIEIALPLIVQIGNALSYAHQRDKVHGNIKPENILFLAPDRVCLTDFSVRALAEPVQSAFTLTTSTCPYWAPEQFSEPPTKASDQYAFACVIYEMITGCLPYTNIEQLEAVPPSQIIANFPQHVEQALLKALAKDPGQRYNSVTEFMDALQATPAGFQTTPDDSDQQSNSSSEPLPATTKIAVHKLPTRRLSKSVLAVIVAVCIILLFYSFAPKISFSHKVVHFSPIARTTPGNSKKVFVATPHSVPTRQPTISVKPTYTPLPIYSPTPTEAVVHPTSTPAPSIQSSVVGNLDASPTFVNLTTEGTIDWASWGYQSLYGFVHKNGVPEQISPVTFVNPNPPELMDYGNSPTTFSWSNGTPIANTEPTESAGIATGGGGRGFQFTVPASTAVHTLRVYVGVNSGRGVMVATLSDGTSYQDDSLSNVTDSQNGLYVLHYRASTNNQLLTIRYTVYGNDDPHYIMLQAATLQ